LKCPLEQRSTVSVVKRAAHLFEGFGIEDAPLNEQRRAFTQEEMRDPADVEDSVVRRTHAVMETRQRLESILNMLRESREKALAAKKAEAVVVQDRVRNPCRDRK